jgi:hypothetical protein
MIPWGIELATSLLVALCLNQLRHFELFLLLAPFLLLLFVCLQHSAKTLTVEKLTA